MTTPVSGLEETPNRDNQPRILPPVFPYRIKQGLNNVHYSIYMIEQQEAAEKNRESKQEDVGSPIALVIQHEVDPRDGGKFILCIEKQENMYTIWGLGPVFEEQEEDTPLRCTTFYRTFETLQEAFAETHAAMMLLHDITPLLDPHGDSETLTRGIFSSALKRGVVLRNPACPLEAQTAYFLSAVAVEDPEILAYLSYTPTERAVFHYLFEDVKQNSSSRNIMTMLAG